MADSPHITAVIGPTGTGKTDLALGLAERLGAEILCVDSMTVYRGMDIGTAKPTPEQQARVKHHLIDLVEPDQPFTVARFVELADAVIRDAAARRVPLIAVGGTPMYFKALFEGIFDGPGADEAIRARLSQRPNEELHAELSRRDPDAAARIHVNDRKRLIRALEVFQLTGHPISTLQTHWIGEPKWRHPVQWIGLCWQREELSRRINARVRRMISAGWVDEVRRLLQRHGELSHTASEAAGYAELIAHVRGQLSLEEAIERIKIGTRQLSRRQMKWFRRFREVTWLQGVDDTPALIEQAASAISRPATNHMPAW